MEENIIEKTINNLARNKAKIIDDFFLAYLSARWGDYTDKNELIKRLKLVEERSSDGLKIKYYFELKKGKLPTKEQPHDTKHRHNQYAGTD